MSRMTRPDALTVGETMVMVAPPIPARIGAETSFMLRPGGAEANVAIHLSRLGHHAQWAGLLGDDPFGGLVRSYLLAAGVGVEYVRVMPGSPTGVYFKDTAPEGSRVYYYRTNSAASKMDCAYVDTLREVEPTILHLSGITPALSDDCREAMRRLLVDRVVAASCVSFDVNFRPDLWRGCDVSETMREFAAAADVVFVGLDEASALWNVENAQQVRDLLPEPRVLVVKNAQHGAVSFQDEGSAHALPEEVEVIEPVGAGDAFAAGWLSGLLRGVDPDERLALGHAVAAQILQTTFDDIDLPQRLAVKTQRVPGPHALTFN